ITHDHVSALLGSATPPLTIPTSIVADKAHIPIINPSTPIRAFMGSNPKWDYAWTIFFDELEMTQLQMKTMNTVPSNHKVALFTDTELDGKVMGGLWEQNAPKQGYTIAYHANFPLG